MNTKPNNLVSVSELNRRAKSLLETHLTHIEVEGELSNFSRPSSGHWYFSLKDDNAQIRCAMFRGKNLLLNFTPKAGDQIIVKGRVSLYEPRGDYQLIADHMRPAGEGALKKQFDELKQRLSQEGLFEHALKKPLPKHARHIAVISSPSGAAVHDILHVLARRAPDIKITLIPSSVQGQDAPKELVRALSLAQQLTDLDAIILGRGGGSLEDLWAFNDEALARAIHANSTPIISAVGHETDISISDFVADVRAPTPSAAAELISGDIEERKLAIQQLFARAHAAITLKLEQRHIEVRHQEKRLRHPGEKIRHWQQRTDISEQRLKQAIRSTLNNKKNALRTLRSGLKHSDIALRINANQNKLSFLTKQLNHAMRNTLFDLHHQFSSKTEKLELVSPLATISRGYSIAKNEEGEIVRSVKQIKEGDKLNLRVADGRIQTRVIETAFLTKK